MRDHTLFLISLWLLMAITSCHPNRIDDDDSSILPTDFTNGFFILNEGIAGDRNGSLSFYDREQKKVYNNVYEAVNGFPLEGTLISLSDDGSALNIIQNRNGQITHVDKTNLFNNGITSGLKLPRFYQQIHTQKAFVSQWGENGGIGSIQIINPATKNIIGQIITPGGPERMLQHNNHLYLTHSGGFFMDSVVTKIDINTNQILKTIGVGLSPQSLQLDANGTLWVLSKGSISFSETRPGVLAKIVNDEVILSISVPAGSRDLIINNERNSLYFINGSNQKVYQQNINSNALVLTPFTEVPVSALGFDPVTNLIVGLDAQNFQIPGKLLLFDNEGKVSEEFTVGYVPNYLAF